MESVLGFAGLALVLLGSVAVFLLRTWRWALAAFAVQSLGIGLVALTIVALPMIPIRGGAVQPHPAQGYLKDRQRGGPQIPLNGLPRLVITQATQHTPQPVVAEVHLTDGATKQPFQGIRHRVGPFPHSRFAMIGLGENIAQPAHGQLAVIQPLLQSVSTQMRIEYLTHSQLVSNTNDQRNVVYAFVSK